MSISKRVENSFRLWRREFSQHKRLILLSFIFLILSVILNSIAGNYTTKKGDSIVSDVIISNIPPIDLSFIFVWGFVFVLVVLFLYPLSFKVSKLHETIGQFSLLIILRSFFKSLTHLKVPVDAIHGTFPSILQFLVFENDLFFSGHTAVPFLGFLIFKESKIRYFFLASSITMAITVLLMHVHYSIDVFAAFFITYGSYKIGKWMFGKIERGNK